MSKYTLVFHHQTAADYDDGYAWYEDRQKGLGDTFLIAINEKVKQVCDNPELFSEKSKRGFFEAVLKDFPYTVVYKIYKKEKIIVITSIHHQKKHPKSKYRK